MFQSFPCFLCLKQYSLLQPQSQTCWGFLGSRNISLEALCAVVVSECGWCFLEVHLSPQGDTTAPRKNAKKAINHCKQLCFLRLAQYPSPWSISLSLPIYTTEWEKCLGKGQFLLFLLSLVLSPRCQHAQASTVMEILCNFVFLTAGAITTTALYTAEGTGMSGAKALENRHSAEILTSIHSEDISANI